MYRSELHQQTESTDQFTWRELVIWSVPRFSLCFLISTLLLLGNGNLIYTRLLEKNEGTDQMQISISTDQVDLYPTVPTEVWSLPQFLMDKRRYRSVWSVLYFSLETLICEMISTPFFIYDPDLYPISYEKAGYRSIPNLQKYQGFLVHRSGFYFEQGLQINLNCTCCFQSFRDLYLGK